MRSPSSLYREAFSPNFAIPWIGSFATTGYRVKAEAANVAMSGTYSKALPLPLAESPLLPLGTQMDPEASAPPVELLSVHLEEAAQNIQLSLKALEMKKEDRLLL